MPEPLTPSASTLTRPLSALRIPVNPVFNVVVSSTTKSSFTVKLVPLYERRSGVYTLPAEFVKTPRLGEYDPGIGVAPPPPPPPDILGAPEGFDLKRSFT